MAKPAITKLEITVAKRINPSVVKGKDGKFYKIPCNVAAFPDVDEKTSVMSDWEIDSKSHDAQEPVPVTAEGLTTDNVVGGDPVATAKVATS